MSHFICTYVGNKYREFKKNYYDLIDIKDDSIIIEPFAGSCGMSFYIWQQNKKSKTPKKLTFILNDISYTTYEIYQLYKRNTPNEIEQKITEAAQRMKDKDVWKKVKGPGSTIDIYEYIVFNKFKGPKPYMYPQTSDKREERPGWWDYKFTPLQLEFFEFIRSENVHIYNQDWKDVFDIYKDNENAIFLFDPPYIMSSNVYYDDGCKFNISKKVVSVDKTIEKINKQDGNNKYQNVYEFFAEGKKYNSTIYFILEDMWIIKLLFRNSKVIHSIDKIYALSKKKTKHMLIKYIF
jgi:hypothetical protein